MTEQRPELNRGLDPAELQRWYWKGSELSSFARELGISTRGPKAALVARLSATLAGAPLPREERPRGRTDGMVEPLELSTLIPPGQSCTQAIRKFMVAQLGTRFSFDGPMREFFHGSDGSRTLEDAVSHWRSTRDRGPQPIGVQFELNRFSRSWHQSNPEGTRAEMLIAWEEYKSLPVERRKG